MRVAMMCGPAAAPELKSGGRRACEKEVIDGQGGREREGKTSKRGRTLKRIVRKLLECVLLLLLWPCFNSSPTHILLLLCTYAEPACV